MDMPRSALRGAGATRLPRRISAAEFRCCLRRAARRLDASSPESFGLTGTIGRRCRRSRPTRADSRRTGLCETRQIFARRTDTHGRSRPISTRSTGRSCASCRMTAASPMSNCRGALAFRRRPASACQAAGGFRHHPRLSRPAQRAGARPWMSSPFA